MSGEFYGIDVSSLESELAQIRDRLESLEVARHSFSAVEGSRERNWQAGSGTSGEGGADLLSLGEAGKRKLVHSLLVDIRRLTPGAKISIKMFMKINGVERKLYPPNGTSFTVGSDPDGLWVINGTLAIHDPLRIELESDNPGDNGKSISYTAVVENM
jgi:hypothetical protein